jgi:hypothetical protein
MGDIRNGCTNPSHTLPGSIDPAASPAPLYYLPRTHASPPPHLSSNPILSPIPPQISLSPVRLPDWDELAGGGGIPV